MDPDLVVITQLTALTGKNAGGGSPQPPVDSPLKVWDGTHWVPAGVKVEE